MAHQRTTSGRQILFANEVLPLLLVGVAIYLFLAIPQCLGEDLPRFVEKELPRHMVNASLGAGCFLVVLFPWS